jgi:hypothetical protein
MLFQYAQLWQYEGYSWSPSPSSCPEIKIREYKRPESFLVILFSNMSHMDTKGILIIVYNNQNYWLFRLCPSSSILKTGSVSVLR